MLQEFTSAGTSINKNKLPALFTKVSKHFGWKKHSTHLDIGAGKYHNHIFFYLQKYQVFYLPYDPYNLTEKQNKLAMRVANLSTADSTSISNVLNTIKEETFRREVLELAHKSLKKGGVCYITCYNSGKKGVSKKDCYQVGKPLKWYMPMVIEVFGNAEQKYNMIIARKQ